jgi:hypothetical protein
VATALPRAAVSGLSKGEPPFKGLQANPLTRVLRASDLKTMMRLERSESEKL